jgi:Caspase domain
MNDHDRAVVIGIRRYPDAASGWITNLNGPDNDADAVAAWLRKPDGGGLPHDNVRVVRSANFPDPFPSTNDVGPQQHAVVQALNDIARLSNTAFEGQYTGRRLYIYVSGHGFARQDDEAALMTAEAELQRPANVEVKSWLDWFRNASRFKEFVLWADCCATRTAVSKLTLCDRNPEFRGNANDGRVFSAFAARFNERAVETQMEDGKWHGVFTWALLRGLSGAAASSNAVVTSKSLEGYLRSNMKSFMRKEQQDDQGVSKEPAFGKVQDIEFSRLAVPRFPVTLRFPAACIGKLATIVTTPAQPPAAQTTLAEANWNLLLEAGKYAAFAPTLGFIPFIITGENANGVLITL